MVTPGSSRQHWRKVQPPAGLGFACLLSILLLCISYVRILGDVDSAAFGSDILDTALAQPMLGTALGNNLGLFRTRSVGSASEFWHRLLLTSPDLGSCMADTVSSAAAPGFCCGSCAGTVWILIANATRFPTSSLGSPYAGMASATWNGIDLLHIASAALLLPIAATLAKVISILPIRLSAALSKLAIPGLALVLLVSIVAFNSGEAVSKSSQSQPNVIIIGVDSLRVDAVRRGNTPAIDSFLDHALTFSDATTPLARTFPSWVSILSGRHPHTTGAIVNLLPRDMVHTGETLPQLLNNAGYKSIYAIDEVRFSNLDMSYGFEEMISPPMGATDFLLSFFADVPLSNIVLNTPVGRALFPFSYANRGAALTYDPDSFVRRIDREVQTEGPTFLAIHLTLPHWPYNWAGTQAPPPNDSVPAALTRAYAHAVTRVDRQFADILRVLDAKGLLDNAIVVVLSDHGESLGQLHGSHDGDAVATGPGDYLVDPANAYGHGTSVFHSDQYRVLLSIRHSGQDESTKGKSSSVPASVEDVMPTIVDLLSLPSKDKFDGLSLASILHGEDAGQHALGTRIRFTETEFNPDGILPGKLLTTSALQSAAGYYQLDPVTDRVTLKKDVMASIMAKRQYAAFRAGRMLAAIPSADATDELRLAYVAAEGEIPTLLDLTNIQMLPEAVELWAALRRRFPEMENRHTLR